MNIFFCTESAGEVSSIDDANAQTHSSVTAPGTDSEDLIEDELFEDVLQCLQPKKKRFRIRRRGPFRVPRVDIRRQFCTMFTNMMNMQDFTMTRQFFDTFCTPDIQMSMFCAHVELPYSGEKIVHSATQLHIQSQPAVSQFVTLLQHFSPDLVITVDNIELLTRYSSEEVTVRGLMGINNTVLYKTPPPLLAHQYLLDSTSANGEQSGRKRKYESNDLPLMPYSMAILERVKMELVVQLQFKVDKEKRITSIEFSLPVRSVFEP